MSSYLCDYNLYFNIYKCILHIIIIYNFYFVYSVVKLILLYLWRDLNYNDLNKLTLIIFELIKCIIVMLKTLFNNLKNSFIRIMCQVT